MVELGADQPGFLGIESARGANGLGITVSYWASEEAIRAWKSNAEHQIAQETGKRTWYTDYEVRIAKVERAYGMPG
jgi:heme-degrading monooxygenase HmoA